MNRRVSDSWYRRNPSVWPYAVLGTLAVTALLAPGITPSFSSDDYIHLERNLDFESFPEALAVFLELDGREYRPLVRLSLWLNGQLGETAIAYHITNTLLHLGCMVLVFLLLVRLAAGHGAALAGTAVFALHPIHSTSIHFVMGRTDLLCALFFLTALLFFAQHLHSGRIRFLILSMLAAVLSLSSKEMAVSIPLAALVIAMGSGTDRFRKRFLATLPLFALATGYVIVRLWLWRQTGDDVSGYTDFDSESILLNYVHAVFALAWPFDLFFARELIESSPWIFPSIAIAAIAGIALAWWLLRARPFAAPAGDRLLVAGILLLVITLVPVTGGEMHRWYLYLPSVGLSMVVAAVWQRLPTRAWLHAVAAGLLVVYAAELLRQSMIWREQSKISEAFYLELERNGIPQMDSIALAHVPWAYRGAFLFTWESLDAAMRLRYGRSPDTRTLSYIHLDKMAKVQVVQSNNDVIFQIDPNSQRFFLFPPAQRRFDQARMIETAGYSIQIEELDRIGRVSVYLIEIPDPPPVPLFYFDGDVIRGM